MYEYSNKRSFRPKSVDGIELILRKTNEARRAQLMREVAPLIETEREILRRFEEINARAKPVVNEDGTPKMDLETCEQVKELSKEDTELVNDVLNERDIFRTLKTFPIWIRWGVANVKGLILVDDDTGEKREATVEDLIADAPDGLIPEIIAELQNRTDASSDLKKKSSLPSTSAEASPDQTPASSAPNAKTTEISNQEIAPGSSPS